jgi:hypothetical protein
MKSVEGEARLSRFLIQHLIDSRKPTLDRELVVHKRHHAILRQTLLTMSTTWPYIASERDYVRAVGSGIDALKLRR